MNTISACSIIRRASSSAACGSARSAWCLCRPPLLPPPLVAALTSDLHPACFQTFTNFQFSVPPNPNYTPNIPRVKLPKFSKKNARNTCPDTCKSGVKGRGRWPRPPCVFSDFHQFPISKIQTPNPLPASQKSKISKFSQNSAAALTTGRGSAAAR